MKGVIGALEALIYLYSLIILGQCIHHLVQTFICYIEKEESCFRSALDMLYYLQTNS